MTKILCFLAISLAFPCLAETKIKATQKLDVDDYTSIENIELPIQFKLPTDPPIVFALGATTSLPVIYRSGLEAYSCIFKRKPEAINHAESSSDYQSDDEASPPPVKVDGKVTLANVDKFPLTTGGPITKNDGSAYTIPVQGSKTLSGMVCIGRYFTVKDFRNLFDVQNEKDLPQKKNVDVQIEQDLTGPNAHGGPGNHESSGDQPI